MDFDDLIPGLNESQIIVLERINKAILGLSIREAKEVIYKVLKELEEQTISRLPS